MTELPTNLKQILELMAKGYESGDIATEINKPTYWVRRQKVRLLAKLCAANTNHAIARGFLLGILSKK